MYKYKRCVDILCEKAKANFRNWYFYKIELPFIKIRLETNQWILSDFAILFYTKQECFHCDNHDTWFLEHFPYFQGAISLMDEFYTLNWDWDGCITLK